MRPSTLDTFLLIAASLDLQEAILAALPERQIRPIESVSKKGYEHWLLKFDGVSNNRYKELADPQGFGKIEYAYYRWQKLQASTCLNAACTLRVVAATS